MSTAATEATNNDPILGKTADETMEDTKPPAKPDPAVPSSVASEAAYRALLATSLFRMTDGIPRRELKLIVAEAEECEKELKEELEMLQKALEAEQLKNKNKNAAAAVAAAEGDQKADTDDLDDETKVAVSTMMESEATPTDEFWTLSALLGRLRHDLTTPLPPHSLIPSIREQNGLGQLQAQLARKIPPYLKKKRGSVLNQTLFSGPGGSGTTTPAGSGRSTPVSGIGIGAGAVTSNAGAGNVEISQFQRLLDIDDHPVYTREQAKADQLMSLWKKISMHKSSLVFRKPVNPKEAPGYAEKIVFPMDLSAIRKLILARTITSYKEFSQRIALICHNCVKYNGRESDYALVAREFESVCSEFIWIAVQDEIAEGAATTAADTTATTITSSAAAAPPPASASTSTSKSNVEAGGVANKDSKAPQKTPAAATTTATDTATTVIPGSGLSNNEDANTSKKRKHEEGEDATTNDKVDDDEKKPPTKVPRTDDDGVETTD